MKIITSLLFFSLATLVACNKPDPNPELKDPIYNDLNTQIGLVTAAVTAEEKQLTEFETTLKGVEPQTGQIKYAQKRVYDSQNKLEKLKQQKLWLELRAKDRLKETKKSYMKAFKEEKPWPDPSEFEQYQVQNKLRSAKKDWDVKKRLEDANAKPVIKKGH